MKKIVLKSWMLMSIFLIAMISGPLAAQKVDGNKDEIFKRIKAEKIAYFTEKLSLTEEEAQRFWPVYNQYEKESFELYKSMRGLKFKFSEMSDSDADLYMKRHLEIKEKEFQLEKSYMPKFKNVLSSKKTAGVFYYEKQFRNEMLDKVRSRMPSERKERGRE
jgi:hypothetical protein